MNLISFGKAVGFNFLFVKITKKRCSDLSKLQSNTEGFNKLFYRKIYSSLTYFLYESII